MNRYQEYVPVRSNYTPHVLNMEMWGKALKEQQQKYDMYNSTLDNLTPKHNSWHGEEAQVWNKYMEDSKQEVQTAFLNNPSKGNSVLKSKLNEIQKEVRTGLYAALEGSHAEATQSAQQLQEDLKDQSGWRKEHYELQFKKDALNYDPSTRAYNHMSPITVNKDPETSKVVFEFTKSLVPPEIMKEVTEVQRVYNEDGSINQAASGRMIINTKKLEKMIDYKSYQAQLQQFIASRPELQEDLQMQAQYFERRRTPEEQALMDQAHIETKKLELEKEDERFGKLLNTTDAKTILDLKAKYSLPTDNANMTPELQKALKDEKADIEDRINNEMKASPLSRDVNSIINHVSASLYSLIPNVHHSTYGEKHDELYMQSLREAQDWRIHMDNLRQKALDRANASANAQLMANATLEGARMGKDESVHGFVTDATVNQSPLTAFSMIEKVNTIAKDAEDNLSIIAQKFNPGYFKATQGQGAKADAQEKALGFGSQWNALTPIKAQEPKVTRPMSPITYAGSVVKKVKQLPSNFYSLPEPEKRKWLKLVDLAPTNTPYDATVLSDQLRVLESAYDEHMSSKAIKEAQDHKLGNSASLMTSIESTFKEDYIKYIQHKEDVYRDAAGGLSGFKPISYEEFKSNVATRQAGFENYNDNFQKVYNKHPELKNITTDLQSTGYNMSTNPDNPTTRAMKDFGSSVVHQRDIYKGLPLPSLENPKQPALFRDNNTGKLYTEKQLEEKLGFKEDRDKLGVRPVFNGANGAGLEITKRGKLSNGQEISFTSNIAISDKNMKNQLSKIMRSEHATASDDQDTQLWISGYLDHLEGTAPIYVGKEHTDGTHVNLPNGYSAELLLESKRNVSGMNFAPMKIGDEYYLGVENKNGWDILLDENNTPFTAQYPSIVASRIKSMTIPTGTQELIVPSKNEAGAIYNYQLKGQ